MSFQQWSDSSSSGLLCFPHGSGGDHLGLYDIYAVFFCTKHPHLHVLCCILRCLSCIECDRTFYAGSVQLSELDDTRDVMQRDQIQTTSLPGRLYQVETAMKDQHGESLLTHTSTSQAPSKMTSHLK